MATKSSDPWHEIVLQQEVWLRQFISRRIECVHTANDIFQEVIAAGLNRQTDQREVKHMNGWLYGIAVRKIAKHYSSAAPGNVELNDTPDVATLPIEAMIQAEDTNSIQLALNSLDDVDRQILNMIYLNKNSYKQIAQKFSLTRSQVIYGIRRAKSRLADKLRQFNLE